MKKVNDILKTIFAIGILLCLLAGGLSVIGYVVAMFVGGETATEMCAWIFKTYLPWVIKATSIFTGIGLITMYLSKQKALTVSNDKKEDTEATKA